MTVNYPLGDMLIRIKNAYLSRRLEADFSYSQIKEIVLKLLKREKFIDSYKVESQGAQQRIRVILSYEYEKGKNRHRAVMRGLKLISKPGRRIYVSAKKIPSVFSGLGINILSTSKGIMTGTEARAQKVGGELICQVW